ncbi:MAG: hypothetical protein AAF368_11870, partial [Planctomycetota bacterium]
ELDAEATGSRHRDALVGRQRTFCLTSALGGGRLVRLAPRQFDLFGPPTSFGGTRSFGDGGFGFGRSLAEPAPAARGAFLEGAGIVLSRS